MRRLVSIVLFLCSIFTNAQQLQVSADKNPAIIGEQILIQYSIDENGNNFISPNFNGLQVLSGPNPSTQSSYSFVNGKSESKTSTTYSYYLKAIKEGIYNISPASITISGKTIKSKNYQLKIVKGNQKNKSQQKVLSENLFIKDDVSKRNIVVGEQI